MGPLVAIMTRWTWAAPLVALLVTALAVSCGGDEEKAEGPLPSAEEAVTRLVERANAVESFHFKLDHEGGLSPIPLGLKLKTAEGDIAVPDRLKAKIEAQNGAVVNVDIIGIGDKAWMTNPFSRQWQELPSGVTIRNIFDPAAGIRAVTATLKSVSVAPGEEVAGVVTYRIEGDVDSAVLEAAAPIAEPGLTVHVVAWVDREDFTIRRIRLEGPFSPDEPAGIVRILELSRFDEPVQIEPPL